MTLKRSLLASAAGNMKDGNWKIARYLDERTDERQRAALQGIFSGAEGGHLANLGPLIGEVLGVKPAKIAYRGDKKSFRFEVEGVGTAEAAAIAGQESGAKDLKPQMNADKRGWNIARRGYAISAFI